jgi:hypothetical protein
MLLGLARVKVLRALAAPLNFLALFFLSPGSRGASAAAVSFLAVLAFLRTGAGATGSGRALPLLVERGGGELWESLLAGVLTGVLAGVLAGALGVTAREPGAFFPAKVLADVLVDVLPWRERAPRASVFAAGFAVVKLAVWGPDLALPVAGVADFWADVFFGDLDAFFATIVAFGTPPIRVRARSGAAV